jgi:hypothetical protein
MRPSASVSMFGSFEMKDIKLKNSHETLVSIPLYCKMAGLSMNEIEYHSYIARLKPEFNSDTFFSIFAGDFYKLLTQAAENSPSEEAKFINHYKLLSWEGVFKNSFLERASFLEKIFSIVTVISMCLCFFSLSSSMTANIFE